jgi:type II secretory pathway component PulC
MKQPLSNFIYVVFLALGVLVWAAEPQGELRDPFEAPPLRKEDQIGEVGPEGRVAAVSPPAITVEGVVWGKDSARVIIDGEIYEVGDTLKNVDAKVYKIEANTVSIAYQGGLFEMSPKKRGE